MLILIILIVFGMGMIVGYLVDKKFQKEINQPKKEKQVVVKVETSPVSNKNLFKIFDQFQQQNSRLNYQLTTFGTYKETASKGFYLQAKGLGLENLLIKTEKEFKQDRRIIEKLITDYDLKLTKSIKKDNGLKYDFYQNDQISCSMKTFIKKANNDEDGEYNIEFGCTDNNYLTNKENALSKLIDLLKNNDSLKNKTVIINDEELIKNSQTRGYKIAKITLKDLDGIAATSEAYFYQGPDQQWKLSNIDTVECSKLKDEAQKAFTGTEYCQTTKE